MTREEAKSLEGDIANDVLNNFPLSGLVVLATEAAKARAKQIMDESTEEDLTDMKVKYAEAKAKVEAQRAESEQPVSAEGTSGDGTSGTSGE
jgi:hypothetical protein